MERVRSAVFVHMRQYGIVAPMLDIQRKTTLATSGLYSCFGLALYDPSSMVGVLSHLDRHEGVIPTVYQASKFFRALGVRELTVATVNLYSQHLGRRGAIEGRETEIERAIALLTRNGCQTQATWQDIGQHENVLLDLENGLVQVPDDDLTMSAKQSLEHAFYYASLVKLLITNPFGEYIPRCAYLPELVPISR